MKENSSVVDSVKVIAKIIRDAESEFVTNVTICNNRQNPVDPWNLRANDLIQCAFEDKFREFGEGIFYERQEKAFKNLTDEEREEKGILETRAITIKNLAQTFLAVQGQIDKIARLRDVFENENIYKSTFKNEYLKTDAKKIILIYKIHFNLPSIIRSIEAKGYRTYWWVQKAKNLIWALLIQGVLNDDDLEGILELYGSDLTVDANFKDYLKGIASKKIRFILSDISGQPNYLTLLESDPPKYIFLQTKIVFQEAMNIARKKYKWEKQILN